MRVTSKEYIRWMAQEFRFRGQTENTYDSIAEQQYDYAINYEERVRGFRVVLSKLKTKPHCVLDLACGTGAFIDAMPFKKSVKILGVDISSGMLKVARDRFKAYKNISFRKADMVHDSFGSHPYDLVTIGYATRFVSQAQESLFAKKLSALVTEDGRLIVTVMDAGRLFPFMMFVRRLTGLPRGSNICMTFSEYFNVLMSPYFVVEQTVRLHSRYLLFSAVGVILKKR